MLVLGNCEFHFITTVSHLFTLKHGKKTEIMNLSLFGNSLVGVLQLLDLPLQLKVVSTACRHPAVRGESGGVWGGWWKRKVSHNNASRCHIISLSFLSLPISVWMHECYLPPVASSSVSFPTSVVSHISFWLQSVSLHYGPSDCAESSLIMMPYWYALLAYDLITNKCWHHSPLTISHPHKVFWWAEAADLKPWWDVNSTLFDIYKTRSISNDFLSTHKALCGDFVALLYMSYQLCICYKSQIRNSVLRFTVFLLMQVENNMV